MKVHGRVPSARLDESILAGTTTALNFRCCSQQAWASIRAIQVCMAAWLASPRSRRRRKCVPRGGAWMKPRSTAAQG